MASHRPGETDIAEQRKTFNGFVRVAAIVVVVAAAILVLPTTRI